MERKTIRLSKRLFDHFLLIVDGVIFKSLEEIKSLEEFGEHLDNLDWSEEGVKHDIEVPLWIAHRIYDGLLHVVEHDNAQFRGGMAFTIGICLSAFKPEPAKEPASA